MRGEEFDDFANELKQLCASLGKAYTDALVQAYWRVLRDVSLEEVQAHVERILLNAKKDTKFPRPADLRSTPPTQLAPPSDPAFREAEDRSIRNLEELRQRDPSAWEKNVRAARVAEGKDPDCNAIQLHRQFGNQLWYDLKERCWRV